MKRPLFVLAICFFSFITHPQNVLSRKEIYRVDCKAVVQIKADSEFGVGFIVSADGMIVTANHVVTARESAFKRYAAHIDVLVPGREHIYPARTLTDSPPDDDVNFDSALLRITASDLPHLILGSWDEVGVGDNVTVLPSFPGIGCMLLEGVVSAKFGAQTTLGPKPVKTIVFQAPIRNGFSGSPIFDYRGRVIGIEDTKVFGISPALDALRSKWQTQNQGPMRMQIGGTDLASSFSETINNLDQNLVSGLGSGVAIDYAKERQESASKPHK